MSLRPLPLVLSHPLEDPGEEGIQFGNVGRGRFGGLRLAVGLLGQQRFESARRLSLLQRSVLGASEPMLFAGLLHRLDRADVYTHLHVPDVARAGNLRGSFHPSATPAPRRVPTAQGRRPERTA